MPLFIIIVMIELITEAFQYPFMQRALIAGIFIGVVLAILGIFVLIKRMAFFGDGVAHASLAGIAIGLLAGLEPLPIAIAYAIGIALAMYFFEKKSQLSTDSIIGIFFTTSLALGVLLLSWHDTYQPDLMSFLFGNILAVTQSEAVLIITVGAALLVLFAFLWRRLSLLVLDPEQARIQGLKTGWLTVFLYIALAVAIVLGVKLVGVILVSALLIIPASSGKLISGSYRGMLWSSIIISIIVIIFGLLSSYVFDLPAGATIVIVGFVVFVISLIIKSFRKN
ncbi:metal ABC transporter permease [Patescibacteria group bacterium]